MENILNDFIAWFDGLSEQPQIDEQVINSFNTLVSWLNQINLNQKLVLFGMLILLLIIISLIIIILRSIYLKIRRWYRKKRIPNNIDLYLDRDNLKYGNKLRKNIDNMKKDAPFKK